MAEQGVKKQKRRSKNRRGFGVKVGLRSGSNSFTAFWVALGVEGFEELGDGMAVHSAWKAWVDDETMEVDREMGSWLDAGMDLCERVEAWLHGCYGKQGVGDGN